MHQLINKVKLNPSLLLLYFIVFIPVLTMCYFLLSDYSHRQEEEIKKNEQMAKILSENLDSYLQNVKTTLISVSNRSAVQRGDRAIIEEIFQSLMLADSQVSMYWAVDQNGQVLAKYPNKWPDKSNDKKYIKEVLRTPVYVSEPRKGEMSGLEIITLSSQIKDLKGNVIGAIGASIPLDNLSRKLQTKVGNTGFPILVSKSGKFLVHPERELINNKITLDDPIFDVILKGGSGTLDIVAPYDEKRKFFSYISLQEADWIVLVVQPLSEFHAENFQFLTRNGVLIFLVIFILALASYYLMLFRKREEEARILQTEKLSLVGQLAAGMAHEIRNPLTSIKGLAQLAATRENGLASDHLDIILSEVNRIESIVKETMLLAKPTPVEFRPIDIGVILGEVAALMQPQLGIKGVKLELSIQESLPFIVGEPNHLKQVFINLIKNSIDAAPEKGGEILIKTKKSENNLVISFQDNGSGISPEIINKLGTPFISTKENGTGLGLMVSYRIIQNHSGKISVKSTRFQETIFTIEIPISS